MVDEISKFLGMPNEGYATYLENVTSNLLFWKFIPMSELDGHVLKMRLKCKNRVNAYDLSTLAYTLLQLLCLMCHKQDILMMVAVLAYIFFECSLVKIVYFNSKSHV